MTDKEKERLIGKQLLLVNCIKDGNETSLNGGFPSVFTEDLVKWSGLSEADIRALGSACELLHPVTQTREISLKMWHAYSGEAHIGLFSKYAYKQYSSLILEYVDIDKFKKVCDGLAKPFYQLYSGTFPEYPVSEAAGTPDIFYQLMRLFVECFVASIHDVQKMGFEWDVIKEMLDFPLTMERFKELEELAKH